MDLRGSIRTCAALVQDDDAQGIISRRLDDGARFATAQVASQPSAKEKELGIRMAPSSFERRSVGEGEGDRETFHIMVLRFGLVSVNQSVARKDAVR